jgi:hypothetical protein
MSLGNSATFIGGKTKVFKPKKAGITPPPPIFKWGISSPTKLWGTSTTEKWG